RVGHGYALDVERPDAAALAVRQGNELGALEDPRLLDPAAGQPQGQRRAVEGEGELAQQERQAAGVVLVAVGQHATLDPLPVLAQPGEVRQDEIDAGHVEVGEHEPAVDEQDPTAVLAGGAVAADLPQPAEEGDGDGLSQVGRPPPTPRGPFAPCPPGRPAPAPAAGGTAPPGDRARATSPWWGPGWERGPPT